MKAFSYGTHDIRVLFGAGIATQLAPELIRIGASRIFILTTAGRSSAALPIAASLGDRIVGQFSGAQRHVPVGIVNRALAALQSARADACMALGGGSAIGLAKAIALETGVPIVAVPTTYSGSEMTSIWGVTDGGVKKTGRDERVAARIVACDPLLTLDLPTHTSAQSGLNAMAHSVEALYAHDANPLASLLARESIRLLAGSLRRIVNAPRDENARADALIGSHLAGRALDMVSMGLHHRLCHVIGGHFDTPHALTHAILLPHVMAFEAINGSRTDAWTLIRIALDGSDDGQSRSPANGRSDRAGEPVDAGEEGLEAARAVHRLNLQLGTTATLKTLGLAQADLNRIADIAGESAGQSQTGMRDGVRALLERAWRGCEPGSPLD